MGAGLRGRRGWLDAAANMQVTVELGLCLPPQGRSPGTPGRCTWYRHSSQVSQVRKRSMQATAKGMVGHGFDSQGADTVVDSHAGTSCC
jgi:hypothetical protein